MLFSFLRLYLCPSPNSGVSGSLARLCLFWWCHGGKFGCSLNSVTSVTSMNLSLCFVCSNALCLFQSRNRMFSLVRALYGHHMNLVKDATFIMDSMNLQFLHTFHYSPSSSPVGVINAMSRRSLPTFNFTFLRYLVPLLSSLCFPLVFVLN
jgi:hypothetical protein